MSIHRFLPALPLLVLPLACSQGGGVSTPGTSVPLVDTHHLYVLSTPASFSKFPISAQEVVPLSGTIAFNKKSTYNVSLGSTSANDRYALDKDGKLSIFVTQSSRPTIRYLGAYGLDGDTGLLHFCDRYVPSSGNGLALFWGAEIAPGMPDLTGDWHVLSLHILFTTSSVLDPDNLARALGGGAVSIDSAGVVTNLQDSVESTKASIELTGDASAFADGRVTLDLDYDNGQSSDTRSFQAAIGKTADTILGADLDEGDGEVGLLAMMKKRSGPADPMALAGTYRLGFYTVFTDVQRPGTDVAAGTLTFNNTNGFVLDATGVSGQAFSYTGTYALDPNVDGGLVLTVPATNETWNAAVDEGYHTVVLVDDFLEQRSGTKPAELSIGVAHREAQ